MDIYDTNTEDEENIHILLDNIEFFQMTPLDMALIGDCKNFVSHPSVQNLLTKIWNGHSAQNNSLMNLLKVDKDRLKLFIKTDIFVSFLSFQLAA